MADEVVAVASGKGGVGKTTTVVNLGVVLRRADYTVALVDADLGMANLGTMLGVEEETTLHDVLAGELAVEDALVEEAPGFALLTGNPDLAAYPEADPRALRGVLETLADRYDFVIVDTGAGMSHEDVLPLGIADRVLLVTTPDPAAIGDTRKTAELAELAAGDVGGVVVTMADAETDAPAVARQVGFELLGAIPFDATVRRSTASATPLEAIAPESPAAVAYRELASALVGEPVELAPQTPLATDSGAGGAAQTTADGTEPAQRPTAAAAGTGVDEPGSGTAADAAATGPNPDAGPQPAGEDAEAADAQGGGLFAWLRRLFS